MRNVRPRTATSLFGRWVRGKGLSDRGAVAVEAALIFPVLIVLTFGIIEFSLLMRDHTATTSLVRAGARTASALPRGQGLPAGVSMFDVTVDAMERAGSAMPKDYYEELWIYKANEHGLPGTADKMENAVCKDNCVKYKWNDDDQFQRVAGNEWLESAMHACPGDSDAVGVYLKVEHEWLTGLFFDKTIVQDNAVMNFEPIATYSSAVKCRP